MQDSFRVERFGDIDSTNAEAFRRAEAGDPGNLWIVAQRQLRGRGRRGRSWASERGNLYASVLLRPACSAAVLGQLSFVSAVAAHAAVAAVAPSLRRDLALKWPNDLLVRGRKLSGILLESAGGERRPVEMLVIGFGINCACHPADSAYPASDLALEGASVAPEDLFEQLVSAFAYYYALWDDGRGFAPIRKAWLAQAAGIGEAVTVRLQTGDVPGLFERLDADGSLVLLKSDGTRARFAAGEVFFDGHDKEKEKTGD